MTTKITEVFKTLKAEKRKALINYIVAGDPDIETTLQIMKLMVNEGVDIIELGIPFSDPMAEGVSIQKGHERALAKGTTLKNTFSLVKSFRDFNKETPIVFMGYMNTFESIGAKKFMTEAVTVGLDGLLIVDMPPEESSDFTQQAEINNVDIIRLIAPTTGIDRARDICLKSSGYVYYISVKGITGSANLDAHDVKEKVNELRNLTDLPIVIGFGIKDAKSAISVRDSADGIVVGSVFVDLIGEGGDIFKKVTEKTRELSEALRS